MTSVNCLRTLGCISSGSRFL